jgi:hypothetical protein
MKFHTYKTTKVFQLSQSIWSQDNSVSTAMGYEPDGQGIGTGFLAEERDFYSSEQDPD